MRADPNRKPEAPMPVRYYTERGIPPDRDRPGRDDLYEPVELYAEFEGGPGGSMRRERVEQVVWHSPTGLEYGYAGSGPADLALSVLAHWYGCNALTLARKIRGAAANLDDGERRAVHCHQGFKFRFVAPADRSQQLVIHRAEIVDFIADELAAERGVTR